MKVSQYLFINEVLIVLKGSLGHERTGEGNETKASGNAVIGVTHNLKKLENT